MSEMTPDPIMRIALGFMAAKHLFVASEIGLFEKLAGGPMTLDALAAASGIPRRTLRISADAMVSLGLLEREGDGYRNARSPPLFSPARPAPICGRCCASGTSSAIPPGSASRAPCAAAKGKRVSSGSARRSSKSSRPGSRRSRRPRRRRSQRPTISAVIAVFSMSAGGTGSFLIAILRRHAGLRGTLFELPGTCAVARGRLRREPEGARIEVIEGDLLKDPLPDDHDAVIAANIVHGLSEAHNLDLLRKPASPCRGRRAAVARRSLDGCEPHRAGGGTADVGGISGACRRRPVLCRRGGRWVAGADRLAQARSPAAGRTGERHHRRSGLISAACPRGRSSPSRRCPTSDRRSRRTLLLACHTIL